jgi:hypothetical protein
MWKVDWIIPLSIRIPPESWGTVEALGKMIENFKGPEPDIKPVKGDPRFVSGYIFPFHYNHPVTGKPTSEKAKNARLLRNIKAAAKAAKDTLAVKPKEKSKAKSKNR